MSRRRSLLALLLFTALEVQAQMGGGFGRGGGGWAGGGGGMSSDGVERRDADIRATGLTAAFPAGFECEPISSPYGSPTRYDGSQRRGDRNGGLHGGMDITLKEGTSLVAVAAGEVIAAGTGGRLEGNFLWLRHAPEDTGLPFWVFTKYQHLSAVPTLKVGDRVQAGQPVALSGNTGTTGGHYGWAGYHHLHLSTMYGPSGKYMVVGEYASLVRGKGAVNDDPLVLYHAPAITHLQQIHDLPKDRRAVSVAVVGEDGAIHPAGAKTVWPVACKGAKKT